jgi:hypothetical protein
MSAESFDDTEVQSSIYGLEDAESEVSDLIVAIESIRNRILNAREDLLYSDLAEFKKGKYASDVTSSINTMNYLIMKLGVAAGGLQDVPERLTVYSRLREVLSEIESDSLVTAEKES